ncbi:choline/ethanoalamine kinase [Holotrichia oblita]|uniref:Choline/ethanoalamine kinase n=1 Tax=Holotrichia oblita TaxID=644536 RepID=A0ACB9SHH1_HOLOL|nr:choline/ethanoalamine kinase [Holotrichia oblita]
MQTKKLSTWLNLICKQMGPDSQEIRELAARICRDYLNGAWKSINSQNIVFKHISGGLSNLLYYISLPESMTKTPAVLAQQSSTSNSTISVRRNSGNNQQDSEPPNSVLIRIYGQTHGDRNMEHLLTESVIFTLLSERGLGPKLYGLFPGGRIEQYIDARPLLTHELSDPALSEMIARKMAAIHSMEVPLHKEPGWLWDTIDRWLKTCEKKLRGDLPDVAKDLTDINLREEVEFLRNRLEAEQSPVVFCHNDMQEGNILIRQDINDNNDDNTKIVLIDFEYCSYNYRSYDLANHFIEWTYNYTVEKEPYYSDTPDDYPSVDQRLSFIRAYLDEMGSDECPQKLLREVEVFTMATHFFWGLWSIVNAGTSVIPFGYWVSRCITVTQDGKITSLFVFVAGIRTCQVEQLL